MVDPEGEIAWVRGYDDNAAMIDCEPSGELIAFGIKRGINGMARGDGASLDCHRRQ
jgi:hypothetical protein